MRNVTKIIPPTLNLRNVTKFVQLVIRNALNIESYSSLTGSKRQLTSHYSQ